MVAVKGYHDRPPHGGRRYSSAHMSAPSLKLAGVVPWFVQQMTTDDTATLVGLAWPLATTSGAPPQPESGQDMTVPSLP